MTKTIFYVVPNPVGSNRSIDDMHHIQQMMGGLGYLATEHKMANFGNFNLGACEGIMPGGEEANEAFNNLQIIKNLANQSKMNSMRLPSDADENIADIMKFVFQYLANEHNNGRALTGPSVHTSMQQLVDNIKNSVKQKHDPLLQDLLFKLGVANQAMVKSNYPSFFPQGMPQQSIFTPPIIKMEVEKFIRENYPVNHRFTNVSEIDICVQNFAQRYPVGVPMDTLGSIFLEVCPLK